MGAPTAVTLGDAPQTLGGLLDRYPVLAPPVSSAGAAVTLVLREGEREVETLLIVRATNPDDPASGQVGLPGGHVSESDGSLASTALRELEEEVGLSLGDLTGPPRFVGLAPAPRFGLTVGVFAAALGPVGRPPNARDPTEVAHVFWLARSSLRDTRRVVRDTHLGPYEVHATVAHGEVLWGFTRRVLRDFFGFPTDEILAGPASPGRRAGPPLF